MENNRLTTTPNSNPNWPLIVGAAIAAVVLIVVLAIVFSQPKDNSEQNNTQVNDVGQYEGQRQEDMANNAEFRDLTRSQHLSALRMYVVTQAVANDNILPEVSEIKLSEVKASGNRSLEDPSTGQPYKLIAGVSDSTDTIGYIKGESCDGEYNSDDFKVTLKKEDGAVACLP